MDTDIEDFAAAAGRGGDGPLATRLREVAGVWARSQHRLVLLAAEFADSDEWVTAGAATAAHWLAEAADVETCTAREWIRIGRRLRRLDASADAFATGRLSYAKIRTLTRVATPETDAELVALAERVPAAALGRAVAAWVTQRSDPEQLEAHQRRERSVRWRTEPDGMTVYTLRLPPLVAARLNAALTARVARRCPRPDRSAPWPSLPQQYADAVDDLLLDGTGSIDTEVVIHVRGDGCSLDDGTPVADSVVERIVPTAFLRALIHDAAGRPIDASGRRRHPTTRQKRVVTERDRVCVDCGRGDLLEYDHDPPFEQTGRTVVDELVLRCGPCHHARHRADPPGDRRSAERRADADGS